MLRSLPLGVGLVIYGDKSGRDITGTLIDFTQGNRPPRCCTISLSINTENSRFSANVYVLLHFLKNSSSKLALRVHTHLWFCLLWILIFNGTCRCGTFTICSWWMHLIFLKSYWDHHSPQVPGLKSEASVEVSYTYIHSNGQHRQVWLQKQFLLYVSLWENKSTSRLSCYCSQQFPHETMVSNVSLKSSSI